MKTFQFKFKRFLVNKTVLQVVISFLMLLLGVYFVKNEHLELGKIKLTITQAQPLYVLLGIALTVVYIMLQSFMYVESFRATESEIPFKAAVRLFLRRNFVSVFLPAGGFSSLAFFNKELKKLNINNTQIYFSSYLYGLCGLITVVIVAIPALFYLLSGHGLTTIVAVAFVFLIALVLVMVYLIYSLSKRGIVYQWFVKYFPKVAILLDDIESAQLNRKHFVYTLLISLCIEFTGIAHIYIAMLALGFSPGIAVALLAYVVMVLLLIASPLLRGLGAIEVSMTLIFVQYGFSAVVAASTTLLFRFFEFWLPLITGLFSFISKKENLLYRIFPPIIIFVLGIINVVSSLTPSIPSRLRMLEDIFPMGITEISNHLVLLFGLVLCLVSYFLFIGSRNAWIMALILSGFSAVGHLLKGVDYEEAIFASIAFFSLVITREYYFMRPGFRLQGRNLQNVLLVFLGSFFYALIGFYYLEKRHFGVEFNFNQSFQAVVKMYFLFEPPDFYPHTKFARFFINSVFISGIGVVLYFFFTLLRPIIQKPVNQDELFEKANEYLARFGRSQLDYFKTYFDKQIFLPKTCEGFISYKISGKYAVVLENPVVEDNESLKKAVIEFDKFCRLSGMSSIYYRIPAESVDVYQSVKKRTLIIGQEAVIDTETFSLQGKEMKTIRNALNKVEAAGYTLKIYEPPLKSGVVQKLQQVSGEWLINKGLSEIGFAQGVFNPLLIKEQTVLAVESHDEKVMAFLNIVPDYAPGEGTYDLIRMSKDASNGMNDFLLVNLFTYFKNKGIRYVNLGLVPLAGIEKAENISERVLKFAYERIRNFAHYRGLREYKEKFSPVWVNKYIAYSSDFDLMLLPVILSDVSKMNGD